MTTEQALARVTDVTRDIVPVGSPEDAKAAMQQYQAIAEAITDEHDYQTFKDKDGKDHKFRKRSGWKKLERFFFVSVEIRDERIFHQHDPQRCLRVRMPDSFKDVTDCGCPVKGVRMWVRAQDTRTGRFNDDVGICTNAEARVGSGASLHDLATRAYNRGANRSVAGLLGVSDPSAEEAQAEHAQFSKEERMALKDAWDKAEQDVRMEAIAAMVAAGAKGANARDVYVNFLMLGKEVPYSTVLGILAGIANAKDDTLPEVIEGEVTEVPPAT